MSRKTKKLRINKKKGNNKKKNKRRTRKIYGGVSIQDKFAELTNNEGEYDMSGLDNILKKYNDETIYDIALFENNFNNEYDTIVTNLNNNKDTPEADLERLGVRLQLFNDIKIAEEIDEFIKLINIDKNTNIDNHDMDELDNKVLIQKNKPDNLNKFRTNYETAKKSFLTEFPDADKKRLALRDNLYDLWVEYLSIDAGEMDDNSELTSNVNETEEEVKEKSELPVSRFPKLSSQIKLPTISFPSLNKTQKKRSDIQKGQAYEREIAVESPKARLIKDINQILKEVPSELNITDFIQEGKPDGKTSFNKAIGEYSDSRLTQLVESLDALVNPKPSADITVGPLQSATVTAPSSGIFNKLKNLTQKKRPLGSSQTTPSLEDHVVLANALSPASDTTVQAPKGSELAGRSAENDLLEAIDKIIEDESCLNSKGESDNFKTQLTAYKDSHNAKTEFNVNVMRTYVGFEAGLRQRILECPDIKMAAQMVLIDYEKRASGLLSTKDKFFNRFTRKNSGDDMKISDILDAVGKVIRNSFGNTPNENIEKGTLLGKLSNLRTALLQDKTDEKVKKAIEENVDLILDWLKSTRQYAEGQMKVGQQKLKTVSSPADKVVINDDVKKLTDRIALLKKNENDVSSIKGLKTANNRTFRQRLFGDKDKDKDKEVIKPKDSGEKLGFNNNSNDVVIDAFKINDNITEEFVSIAIEGDQISIDGKQLDGNDDERRKAWNNARSTILDLPEQNGNTLPSFDAGKITFNVYPNGKVTIQLNDGPVVYINNRDELEKFKNDSRKPTQKPSVLSRISKPFKNMFGSNKSSKKEEDVKVDNGEEGLRELYTAKMDRIDEDEDAYGMGRQLARALTQGPGGPSFFSLL